MVVRKILSCFVLLSWACVTLGQNAQLNIFSDDEQEVYLNGQLLSFPVITDANSSLVGHDTVALPVALVSGTNVLAYRVRNVGWGGGTCASINLAPLGTADTVATDGTWRCTNVPPAGDAWKAAGYSVATWLPVTDFGALADDTGGHPLNAFLKLGIAVADLWYQGAHWVWSPRTCYFRRSFQHTGGGGSVFVRGNWVGHKVYVNGALVGEQTTAQMRANPAVQYSVTLQSGENVVAVEAQDMSPGNDLLLKFGVQWGSGSTNRALSDMTWKASFGLQSGWNNTGFSDAGWQATDTIDAYDPTTDALVSAKWVWPANIYFRSEFTLQPVAVGRTPSKACISSRIGSRELFTLRGERVSAAEGVALRRCAGLLLERGNGVSRRVAVGR